MQIDWAYPAAFVVGALLSVSGTALQSVLRNPLAEPYLLGTVGGASLFATIATLAGFSALGAWSLPAASFTGSCLSLGVVTLVAHTAERIRSSSSADPYIRSNGSTVVLAGFVTGSFTGSLQMLAISYADDGAFTAISKWLFGNLRSSTPASFLLGATALAAVFCVLFSRARQMNILELGRNEAECLGLNAKSTIIAVLGSVAIGTAVSVSIAGAVGFIGLVMPHAARRLTGPRMQLLLPASAVAGGLALTAAEAVSRFLPGDIPTGVICAVAGTPFFMWLLMSKRNGEGRDI